MHLKNTIIWHKISSLIGDIYISANNCAVLSVSSKKPEGQEGINCVIEQAQKELNEYFLGKRKAFDVPICPLGTDFQKKVWEALRQIPYGETASYQDIAVKIGSKNACRAVGNANNKNPILIIIPCHRVVGKDRSLRGFAIGVDVKEKLLKLEEQFI